MAAPPRRIRVCGVPEHFNIPWEGAVETLRHRGIELQWTFVPGGTGAMVQAVSAGETDVAVALTEGIASAVVGEPSKGLRYCGEYVASPLRWMVVTGNGRADVNALRALLSGGGGGSTGSGATPFFTGGRKLRISVSRLGSGSHIMAFVLAQRHGWPPESLSFVVHKDFRTMRSAVMAGDADLFMWEWNMTKP